MGHVVHATNAAHAADLPNVVHVIDVRNAVDAVIYTSALEGLHDSAHLFIEYTNPGRSLFFHS